MGTKDQLVLDLESKPQSAERDRIMQAAMQGHYHDFESSCPLPKNLLRRDLEAAGYHDLAQKCVRGRYDDPFERPPRPERKHFHVDLSMVAKFGFRYVADTAEDAERMARNELCNFKMVQGLRSKSEEFEIIINNIAEIKE